MASSKEHWHNFAGLWSNKEPYTMATARNNQSSIEHFSPEFRAWLNNEKQLSAQRQRLFLQFGLVCALLLFLAIVLDQRISNSIPNESQQTELVEMHTN